MEYNWSFSFNRARVCVSMRLFFHLSIHSIRAVRSSFYAFLRRSAAERNDSKSPLAHLLLLLRPFLVTSGNFDHWWKADNYWVYLLRQKSGEAENENLFFFLSFFSLSLFCCPARRRSLPCVSGYKVNNLQLVNSLVYIDRGYKQGPHVRMFDWSIEAPRSVAAGWVGRRLLIWRFSFFPPATNGAAAVGANCSLYSTN